jgi:hypothetical protein
MARISQKNSRRYRIQFTMRRELFEIYQKNLAQARKLGVVINFGQDFEEWFENQLLQIDQKFEELEAQQTGTGNAPTDEHQAIGTASSLIEISPPNDRHADTN